MIKIPSLNGLRAISIIIVVLAHLKDTHGVPSILYSFISLTCFGNLGVEIFFVISGYLITTILLSEVETNNKINFKRFYIRRFLRIFPVLIAYLLFILSLNSYYHIPIIHFIKSLLYFNNFAVFGGTWLLGHTWSLSVEEQFYMVWPFVINKLSKYIALITGSVFVLAIILRLIGLFRQDLSDVILNPFIGSLDGILIGSYMGFLVYNKKI